MISLLELLLRGIAIETGQVKTAGLFVCAGAFKESRDLGLIEQDAAPNPQRSNLIAAPEPVDGLFRDTELLGDLSGRSQSWYRIFAHLPSFLRWMGPDGSGPLLNYLRLPNIAKVPRTHQSCSDHQSQDASVFDSVSKPSVALDVLAESL